MKDLYILAPLFIVILSTGLGFFVYERDTKNPRNYFFLALMCVFILINLFEIKAVMAGDASGAKPYLIAMALPFLFLPPVVFCFANAYNNFLKIEPEWLYWLINLPFFVLFLSLAKLIDRSAVKISVTSFDGGFAASSGPALSLLVPLYAAAALFSFWPFVKSYRLRALDESFYMEIKSVFYSLFVPFASAFCAMAYFNFFHPAACGSAFVYPLGVFPAAVLLSDIMLTLSIIRHKSFNISIMFNNALIYSALALVISSVYVIIQNFLENFFQSIFKSSSDIYGAISALIVAFLFEPLNRKLNDFINGIIDFFKDINRPIASEAQTPQQRSHFAAGDLKALEVAYIVFAFCFITIFVAAKLLPGIAPKVSYMISAMSLSLSALYILYKILHLPFNMIAYTAISVFFIFVHILFVSLTGGAGFYIEVSGTLVSLICLVSAAGLIGRIIAVRIDEIAFLIPLCLIAALADIWSVFFGVTSELVTKKSAALNYLLMRYPTLSAGDLRQYIGISDFLFATILMGAAMNFKLNVKKTYAGFAAAFFLTFLTVVITHRGIPAIPAISLAFIIINGPRLKIKLEDIKTMLIVISGAGLVFYLISILRRIIGN
ncbi:MAG TPA: hypothetical protein PK467_11305 [Candidatus Wallbacteria bacterium]|nr:hypothetical protein [Candidatus Wallbacteria bacterium]